MESSNQKSGKSEKSKHRSLRSHISFRVKINENSFCQPLFTDQFIWRSEEHSTPRSLIETENQIRVQWVTRTENHFEWEQAVLDGKGALGRGPSPFTSHPAGGHPASILHPCPRPAGGCRLSRPGCFSPGISAGFPLHLCYIFLFSACPHWNNYNMDFKLQHHKKWH